MIRKAIDILGPDGTPLSRGEGARSAPIAKSMLGVVNSYQLSLQQLRLPALQRAADPFSNHPWVFIAAMAVATTASQAPFTVMQEQTPARQVRAGARRSAMRRYSQVSVSKRMRLKSAEEVYDHPVAERLAEPNTIMDGAQLFHYTYLWMALRNEIFWVKGHPGDEDGGEHLWPVPPDYMRPIQTTNGRGELLGWELSPPPWMPLADRKRIVPLSLDQVIHFKVCHPLDPLRGVPRVTPIAGAVETDILAQQHLSAMLRNRAVPKGIMTYKYGLEKEEEEEFKQKWLEQFEGTQNEGKTAFLQGGWEYKTVAATAVDMGLKEQGVANREVVLGSIGAPGSVVGLTNDLNYATQLGQDANFWDKTVIPLMRTVERTLDHALFYEETDDVFGIHDLRDVEALRAGQKDKIAMAAQLASSTLRVPPRVAFEVVHLEVPEYETDDVSPDALELAQPQELPQVTTSLSVGKARRSRNRGQRVAAMFNKMQGSMEDRAARAYSKWIGIVREMADASMARLSRKALGLELVLPDLDEASDELVNLMHGVSEEGVQSAYELTAENVGIPTFDLDDELVVDYLDKREKRMREFAKGGVSKLVRQALEAGAADGESLAQLRARLARVFRLTSSAPKVRTWARTESAGMLNGLRDRMFEAQEVDKHSWSDSGDEHTRADHVRFREAGVKKRGFNYMTVVGKEGVLLYAGYEDGPVGQIVNCRCTNLAE